MSGSVCITLSGIPNLRAFGRDASQKQTALLEAVNYLWGVAQGQYPASVMISTGSVDAARAQGKLTLSSASGTVGGTIGGTAVTVTYATSDANTAGLIAAAINANTTVNKLVSASAAGAVVNIYAHVAGPVGQKILLVASGTGVTASGANLGTGTGMTVGAGGAITTPVNFDFT